MRSLSQRGVERAFKWFSSISINFGKSRITLQIVLDVESLLFKEGLFTNAAIDLLFQATQMPYLGRRSWVTKKWCA